MSSATAAAAAAAAAQNGATWVGYCYAGELCSIGNGWNSFGLAFTEVRQRQRPGNSNTQATACQLIKSLPIIDDSQVRHELLNVTAVVT
jgi:hypothetical protein